MADTPKTNPFFEFLRWLKEIGIWLLNRLRQIYLLRFPLLTALVLALLPWIGLVKLKSLLASLFVSNWWGVFLIASVAFTTAWAILVTARLILSYGKLRFTRNLSASAPPVEFESPVFRITFWQALLASVAAWPVTIWTVRETAAEAVDTSLGQALLWAALGILASLLLLFASVLLQVLVNSPNSPDGGRSRAQEVAESIFIVRWLPRSLIGALARADPFGGGRRFLRRFFQSILSEGFFDEKKDRFLAGHGLAAWLFFLSVLIFVIAGQFAHYDMPALFFVVLLLMMLCWVLSGLSFVYDRYRVPVLFILLLIFYFSTPNYYYKPQQNNGRRLTMLTPRDVIDRGDGQPQKIIVVATEGGGIQAAAWTAQVLAGIQRERKDFGRALRLVSSVSGGSTGAFFFVNGYAADGTVKDESLDLIVKMAEGNSLDDVARGLVYHDFFNVLLFGYWPFGVDRGTALEESWTANCQKVCEKDFPKQPCPIDCKAGTLASWSEGVKAGARPANIFNSTMVEDGDRLLVSNSDVQKPIAERGRQNVGRLLNGLDLEAITAARLSATFPYVSPAARGLVNDPTGKEYPGARYHLVDGGYYDNYGMTSVVEWLDNALAEKLGSGQDLLSEVLVIQIQSFPAASAEKPPSGYIAQALAPVLTLLNIRTSAQASHKEIESYLLKQKWGERVKTVDFRFCCLPRRPGDETKCYDPPLTWKLTEAEKRNVTTCWQNGSQQEALDKVKAFLNGMTPAAQ